MGCVLLNLFDSVLDGSHGVEFGLLERVQKLGLPALPALQLFGVGRSGIVKLVLHLANLVGSVCASLASSGLDLLFQGL